MSNRSKGFVFFLVLFAVIGYATYYLAAELGYRTDQDKGEVGGAKDLCVAHFEPQFTAEGQSPATRRAELTCDCVIVEFRNRDLNPAEMLSGKYPEGDGIIDACVNMYA
ncbi:hypothetical protein [Croceicoccus naphthovorans]|uniref:Uncharacterized protein n=1 Tax=Croceicoccus naphthovorans TaxID=1348774 RepID=A0A0G3XEL8_9SPHN|nr:hypothetical protein [Croceicoccus naphthovorans]AKM09632.1 hypothetical protein AB433_05980 [Croceicoccus naphthovorans]MBB3989589.1 hypothetical protein [Croceicoccus naphthovorans]